MAVGGGGSSLPMDFWDGMESIFMMPSLVPAERKAVWNAVSASVRQELLLHKGIRIPTLGSFDVVHTETLVGNKIVILPRPVFHLARNLKGVQDVENKDELAAGKKLKPLKYAEMAMESSVSRRKVEYCVMGTTSLMYRCLEKGVSVAFVLRDVGVLLIEGSSVQMRFYLDFLEKVTGQRIWDRATLKALQQLDMVVSQAVPIASLSFTGRVIVFPNFEQAAPPTLLSADRLNDFGFIPGEDKRNRTGRYLGLPLPVLQGSTAGEQPGEEEEAMEMRDSSWARKLPEIPGAVDGKKQPVTDQAKGKAVPKGQSDKEAAATQTGRGGRGERKDSLGREGEKEVQLEKEGERRGSLGSEGEKKDHLRRGERRDSVGREGEKDVQLGREGERRDSLRKEGERRDSLRKGERRDSLRKGERRDSLRKEGEKEAGRGREKEAKGAAVSEGEKKVRPKRGEKKARPKRGEKKVSPKRGEKEVSPGRKGEKKAPLRRKREKKCRFKKEEVKYLERENKLLLGRRGESEAVLDSVSQLWRAQTRKPQDSKVFIPQPLGPEAPQCLRRRPEAFWSVLKEPQKSTLAGYSFESSRLLPRRPSPDDGALECPMMAKKDKVPRGPWPWVE